MRTVLEASEWRRWWRLRRRRRFPRNFICGRFPPSSGADPSLADAEAAAVRTHTHRHTRVDCTPDGSLFTTAVRTLMIAVVAAAAVARPFAPFGRSLVSTVFHPIRPRRFPLVSDGKRYAEPSGRVTIISFVPA